MKKTQENKALTKFGSNSETVPQLARLAAGQRYKTAMATLYTGLLVNKYLNTLADKLSVRYRNSMDILFVLLINGGTSTPSDICRYTFRSKQTVTQIIDKLEKEGVLKRGPIGSDRRTRSIVVTPKGVKIGRESMKALRLFTKAVVPEDIDIEHMRELEVSLHQIRKSLYKSMSLRTMQLSPHYKVKKA